MTLHFSKLKSVSLKGQILTLACEDHNDLVKFPIWSQSPNTLSSHCTQTTLGSFHPLSFPAQASPGPLDMLFPLPNMLFSPLFTQLTAYFSSLPTQMEPSQKALADHCIKQCVPPPRHTSSCSIQTPIFLHHMYHSLILWYTYMCSGHCPLPAGGCKCDGCRDICVH